MVAWPALQHGLDRALRIVIATQLSQLDGNFEDGVDVRRIGAASLLETCECVLVFTATAREAP